MGDSLIIIAVFFMIFFLQKEEKSQKAKANFKSALPKIGLLRKAVAPLQKSLSASEDLVNQNEAGLKSLNVDGKKPLEKSPSSLVILPKLGEESRVNKYKLIGKYIDMVSLAVFGVVWVSVTIGFMAAMSA